MARRDNPGVVLGIVGVLLDAYVDPSDGDYLHQLRRVTATTRSR